MKIEAECVGVCQICEDNEQTKLFRVNGKLMCGDCANDIAADRQFAEMAYGESQ